MLLQMTSVVQVVSGSELIHSLCGDATKLMWVSNRICSLWILCLWGMLPASGHLYY